MTSFKITLAGEMTPDDANFEPLLRDLIYELDTISGVDQVVPKQLATQERAKGSDVDLTQLFITVVSTGAFTSLVQSLMGWVTRDRSRTVEIQLGENSVKLSGIGKDEQREVLELFRKHVEQVSQAQERE